MATGLPTRFSAFRSLADDLDAAKEGFLSYCSAKNLSENTLIYYRQRLDALARYIQTEAPGTTPAEMTPQFIRTYIAHESMACSPATANHDVCTLRVFFGYLVEDGYLENSPMHGVKMVQTKKVIIDTFSTEQIEKILSMCRKDFVGIRDRAIFFTMLDCGLRASELCGLTMEDVDWSQQTMRVLGKGNKERLVPFGNACRRVLSQWATRRGNLDIDQFFVTCYGTELNRYRLRQMVARRCEVAKITGVRCSPHTFRHTFAVMYLRAGGDVFSLQKLLGHSDLTMTRRYAELSQTDVQSKHRQFSPADRLQAAKVTTGRKRLV